MRQKSVGKTYIPEQPAAVAASVEHLRTHGEIPAVPVGGAPLEVVSWAWTATAARAKKATSLAENIIVGVVYEDEHATLVVVVVVKKGGTFELKCGDEQSSVIYPVGGTAREKLKFNDRMIPDSDRLTPPVKYVTTVFFLQTLTR